MEQQQPPSGVTVTRAGRPSKVDEAGVATKERLLAAAIAACLEHGYEGASISDIARRADVTTPAIYNYFGSKEELMVAAGRSAFANLRPPEGTRPSASSIVRRFLADDFSDSRRLIIELHMAGQRHPAVGELLVMWHNERAAAYRTQDDGPESEAAIATFFALLLGLCLVESLTTMDTPKSNIADQAARLTHVLFPNQRRDAVKSP
jgi:AcrR family transcriptional regulator